MGKKGINLKAVMFLYSIFDIFILVLSTFKIYCDKRALTMSLNALLGPIFSTDFQ